MDILSPDCAEQLILSSSQQRLCQHMLRMELAESSLSPTQAYYPELQGSCLVFLRCDSARKPDFRLLRVSLMSVSPLFTQWDFTW
ncbi:hypothetical protein U0070_008339 [Myodes glareolus]|uniref:Uncharacterized protein n=1 Tax=Myodes glareolus TaxID=447135 RepID=A0AAW0IY62_MYOGA